MGIEWDRSGAEDPHGFESIYRAHHRYVWQTLRAFGVPEAATDDAVQDVFIVVHRRLGEFEGRAAIRTWLFEILRRIAWRYRTKAKRDASRTDALPELTASVDLEAELERAKAFEVLQRFAEELDEDRLRVFTLSVFGQLRGREIAETLGVNLNTVYARLRSAHASLDRFTTRLKAREATATVRSARASRPDRQHVRRTWAALAVQLGGAPVGAVAATTLGAAWTAWASCGAAVVAASVAAVVLTRDARPLTPPAFGPAATTTVGESAERSPPRRSGSSQAPQPVPVAAAAAPGLAAPPAPRTPRPTEPPGGDRDQPRVSQLDPVDPVDLGDPGLRSGRRLAQEVAAVKAIQAAVDAKVSVGPALHRYRTHFPGGTLTEEVDALAIEDQCHRGNNAIALLSAFRKRWPQSTLLPRLETTCEASIPPQKPRRTKTQSL